MGHDAPAEPIAPHLPRVQAAELGTLLEAKAAGLVVVDVRNPDEFASGHVAGALNIPSTVVGAEDHSELDAAIAAAGLAGAQQVVVHCQLSQVRGPTAAAKLEARLKELGIVGPEVKVLHGGASAFLEEHKGSGLVVLPP